MTLKYEKALRIANDLIGYCRYLGAQDFHLDLCLPPGKAHITVTAAVSEPSSSTLDQINTELRIPRQYEVEQNYWNMAGSENLDGELTMVGMMVDTSQVGYENGLIKIEVERLDH